MIRYIPPMPASPSRPLGPAAARTLYVVAAASMAADFARLRYRRRHRP